MVVAASIAYASGARLGSTGVNVCFDMSYWRPGYVPGYIAGGSLLSDDMTPHFRVCTCGVVSSGCLMYIFAGPLLNILIKKVVFIFLR